VERAQQAVEATRFEKMKKSETQTTGTNGARDEATNDAGKSLKVRSGKIGSYVNDLNEEDINHIDGRVAAMGNPFERL
jgi:hypothetical protein